MRRRLETLITALAVVAALPRAGAAEDRIVTEADCTATSLVTTIAPSVIGEPVRSVTHRGVQIGGGGINGVIPNLAAATSASSYECSKP